MLSDIRHSLRVLRALLVNYPCQATKDNVDTLRKAWEKLNEIEEITLKWEELQ